MATIALYKEKANGVGGLLQGLIKSTNDGASTLNSLKTSLMGANGNAYDFQPTIDSISSSTKIKKDTVQKLEKLKNKAEEFVTTVVNRDNLVKGEINKKKEDFFTKYYYLKPDCEKCHLEKLVCDTVSAAIWCAQNWKEVCSTIVGVVAAIAAIVAFVALAVITFGASAVITAAIVGALVGIGTQLISDFTRAKTEGKSFGEVFKLENLIKSALVGALSGIAGLGIPIPPGSLNSVSAASGKLLTKIGSSKLLTKIGSSKLSKMMGGALKDGIIDCGASIVTGGTKNLWEGYNKKEKMKSSLELFKNSLSSAGKATICSICLEKFNQSKIFPNMGKKLTDSKAFGKMEDIGKKLTDSKAFGKMEDIGKFLRGSGKRYDKAIKALKDSNPNQSRLKAIRDGVLSETPDAIKSGGLDVGYDRGIGLLDKKPSGNTSW